MIASHLHATANTPTNYTHVFLKQLVSYLDGVGIKYLIEVVGSNAVSGSIIQDVWVICTSLSIGYMKNMFEKVEQQD